MTLVLLIPHSEGYILLSDKQNTMGKGYKNTIFKIHLQSDNGPAIGCAGHTPLIKKIIAEMESSNSITNDTVFTEIEKLVNKAYGEVIREASYRQLGLRPEELDLEMFVIKADRDGVHPFHIQGGTRIPINDLSRIYAIPEETPEVRTYLEIQTNSISERLAILTGEEIIRQMAFSNYCIGPPEYHGYDLIRISNDGRFSFEKIHPTFKSISASKLLEHIQAKEAK